MIASFGQAQLARTLDGKSELRGGTAEDRQKAREWISMFWHEGTARFREWPLVFDVHNLAARVTSTPTQHDSINMKRTFSLLAVAMVIGLAAQGGETSNWISLFNGKDLCIWDAAAIAGIETDKVRELSCSYHYVPVMEPGEYEGLPYDGRMTEIQANHLALVEVGRAGSDVLVADRNPFSFKETAMKMSKLGKALFAALCAASPALAADSALPALVGSANRKTFNPKDVKAKLLALDADLDPNQLDNVIDALLDVEQDPKPVETPAAAVDESPADKLRALLAGKVDDATLEAACGLLATPAADEKPDDKGMKKEEVAAAMDAYGTKLRKELGEAEEARRDVRPIVGDVMGMDSAAAVYGFAIDHMKVDRAGVEGAPALRALFKVAAAHKAPAPVHVAQDSAGLAAKFPGAARFSHA